MHNILFVNDNLFLQLQLCIILQKNKYIWKSFPGFKVNKFFFSNTRNWIKRTISVLKKLSFQANILIVSKFLGTLHTELWRIIRLRTWVTLKDGREKLELGRKNEIRKFKINIANETIDALQKYFFYKY